MRLTASILQGYKPTKLETMKNHVITSRVSSDIIVLCPYSEFLQAVER